MGPARAPVHGLVKEATQAVLTALTEGEAPARLGLPPEDSGRGESPSLYVWPLTLVPDRITAPGPDVLRLRVRFLITSDGSAPTAPLLDRALLIAAADPHLDLVLDPIPAQTWIALHARPRVAVVVDVPVRVPRPTPPVVRVRQPLRVNQAQIGTLRGRVVGPGEVPIPGAAVRAVDLGIATRTANDGQFALAGVPTDTPVRLLVSARGTRMSTQVTTPGAEPPVVLLKLEEV